MDSRLRKALHELTEAEAVLLDTEQRMEQLARERQRIDGEIAKLQAVLPMRYQQFKKTLAHFDAVLDEVMPES